MKSRTRAAAFATGALACAGLSAAVAGTTRTQPLDAYGDLRPVAVMARPLDQGAVIGRRDARSHFEVRRVPAAFAPPDALASPLEALGRRLAAALQPGSYLTASSLRTARSPSRAPGRPPGTTPVELTVTGAGALAASRTSSGDRVDVVVSGDAAPGPSAGRTFVAANDVALLAVREAQAQPGLEADRWVATLALERGEALRLIRAESAGAQIRLLAA